MIAAGDSVPSVTFKTRQDGNWVDVSTSDLFADKTVVVFSLPGAFTPTCSSTHLPGYLGKREELSDLGVDSVLCVSVNDSFVMNAWAKDQGVDDEVLMVPDGNGEFTDKVGALVDKTHIGFGPRSWRYSMLVKNGVVDKVFEEDRADPGDPFAVSDVDTMIGYLKK